MIKTTIVQKDSYYLPYGTIVLEELRLPSNEGFFIYFNFSYTFFRLEAE